MSSGQTFELALGEERSLHLPPLAGGTWSHHVEGMSSAIEVRKLWAADPYPDDDEDDEPKPPQDVVFMIRGAAPGAATVVFEPGGSGARQADSRQIRVTVRGGD
ncbi:MAG TPA: hypothetical protein VF660_02735 [Actinomycetota bacterium]|jgi:hypothetical protein